MQRHRSRRQSWAANFGTGSGNSGPDLTNSLWNQTQVPAGQTFSLQLGSLPGGGNLIPDLNAVRALAIAVQDDTAVDYLKLTVTFCNCDNPAEPVETDPVPPSSTERTSGGKTDEIAAGAKLTKADAARQVKLEIGRSVREVDGVRETVDVAPIVRDNRTFLPIRLLEPLGLKLAWDAAEQKATVERDGVGRVELWVGRPTAVVTAVSASGAAQPREVPIDSNNPNIRPFLENNRLMLPLRFVAENLGFNVHYEGGALTVEQAAGPS